MDPLKLHPNNNFLSTVEKRHNMKLVKATRLSAIDVARAVSKPMLVIPQPILEIHKCLTNVRMAQVESNAYIALGIKEEPCDASDSEEHTSSYEEFHFHSSLIDTSDENTNIYSGGESIIKRGVTTRQQAFKRKQQEINGKNIDSEDANNNTSKNATVKSRKNSPEVLSSTMNPESIELVCPRNPHNSEKRTAFTLENLSEDINLDQNKNSLSSMQFEIDNELHSKSPVETKDANRSNLNLVVSKDAEEIDDLVSVQKQTRIKEKVANRCFKERKSIIEPSVDTDASSSPTSDEEDADQKASIEDSFENVQTSNSEDSEDIFRKNRLEYLFLIH